MPTGSPFDGLQSTTFEAIKNVMGFDCSWSATDGGASYVGKVLFKNPTEKLKDLGVVYDALDWEMEYKVEDFAGLKERTDRREGTEVVVIDETQYYVKKVVAVHDGKTFRAALQPVEQ